MTNATTSRVAIAAILLGLLGAPALAQTASSTSPAAQTAAGVPGAANGGPSGMGPGMMGSGMMGSGGMGPGMMMGWGPGWSSGMGPWGMTRHVEGWVAFLKAELKITPEQNKLWEAVADAMRANAGTTAAMHGMHGARDAAASLPDRIAASEKMLTASLDGLHKYKAAVDPLYAALSDSQKKTADELMPVMMGRGMGGAMMSRGMMGRMGMR